MSRRNVWAAMAAIGFLIVLFYLLASVFEWTAAGQIVGLLIGFLQLIRGLWLLIKLGKKPKVEVGPRMITLVDDTGEERSAFDLGESLTVQITGVRPGSVYDMVLLDADGTELLIDRVMSNKEGTIEPSVLI